MVCTGAKDPINSLLSSRRYVSLFQRLGEEVSFCDFKIQNIVASFNTNCAIDLESLANTCGVFASYEPEIFPGLVLRTSIEGRPLCVLVFRSGKCVITGAKTQGDIERMHGFLVTGILREVLREGQGLCSAEYRREVKKRKIQSLLNRDGGE